MRPLSDISSLFAYDSYYLQIITIFVDMRNKSIDTVRKIELILSAYHFKLEVIR